MLNGHEEQEGVNKFEEKDGNSKNYDESDATVDRHRKILHTDNLKLQDEYQRLQQQNNKLQLLLAEYFQRKKCESRFSDECTDEEKERCYHNTLAKLKELQEECVDQKAHFEDQLKKLQEERQKTEDMVETELEIFVVYKREILLQTMKRHGGKRVSLEDLDRLQQVEERREKELARVQLENIKLNMRFSKYQEKFKAHSIGVDGQHLIDYEELKMENHTYNEKIEEQKEALQKVKKKISSTTHTLTQVKEKLEFIKAENLVKRGSLMKLEAHVNEYAGPSRMNPSIHPSIGTILCTEHWCC
uniref:CCDC113/CCDC96 coiled-coil domain-containing protein n=1 Tax=Eptatretus burgeri TaxID=7764 RepID=A0A8C4QNM8_EPTBU